ncbi:unnamed protein product, partial [Didymodactylos carnosus]
ATDSIKTAHDYYESLGQASLTTNSMSNRLSSIIQNVKPE